MHKVAKKHDVLESVIFLGTLKHSKVLEWLQNIDIYAQPSKTEGLPRALVEAMSLGLPCIGTEVGGIPELLDRECIFSNRKDATPEIIKLLLQLNKEKLQTHAKRNFNESFNYSANLIEKRRLNFFNDYKTMIDNE